MPRIIKTASVTTLYIALILFNSATLICFIVGILDIIGLTDIVGFDKPISFYSKILLVTTFGSIISFSLFLIILSSNNKSKKN